MSKTRSKRLAIRQTLLTGRPPSNYKFSKSEFLGLLKYRRVDKSLLRNAKILPIVWAACQGFALLFEVLLILHTVQKVPLDLDFLGNENLVACAVLGTRYAEKCNYKSSREKHIWNALRKHSVPTRSYSSGPAYVERERVIKRVLQIPSIQKDLFGYGEETVLDNFLECALPEQALMTRRIIILFKQWRRTMKVDAWLGMLTSVKRCVRDDNIIIFRQLVSEDRNWTSPAFVTYIDGLGDQFWRLMNFIITSKAVKCYSFITSLSRFPFMRFRLKTEEHYHKQIIPGSVKETLLLRVQALPNVDFSFHTSICITPLFDNSSDLLFVSYLKHRTYPSNFKSQLTREVEYLLKHLANHPKPNHFMSRIMQWINHERTPRLYNEENTLFCTSVRFLPAETLSFLVTLGLYNFNCNSAVTEVLIKYTSSEFLHFSVTDRREWRLKITALYYFGYRCNLEHLGKIPQENPFIKQVIHSLNKKILPLSVLAANVARNPLLEHFRGHEDVNIASHMKDVEYVVASSIMDEKSCRFRGRLPWVIWKKLYDHEYILKEIKQTHAEVFLKNKK